MSFERGGQLLMLLSLGLVLAAAGEVPGPRQAELLLGALSFDRHLKERAGKELNVLVLHGGETGDAEAARDIAMAFTAAGRGGVQGLPVQVLASSFSSVAELLQLARREGIDTLYVDASARPALQSVLQVTRAEKIASLVGDRRGVEAGAAIGITERGGVKVAVNLRAAQVEGLKLEARLLAAADLVR